MHILVIDNYDSFVYNIVQLLRESALQPTFSVARNDAIPFERINDFDAFILSPGPGIPTEANGMPQLLKHYAATKPVLGICLGHQAIIENFGGEIINMGTPVHGHRSALRNLDADDSLYSGISEPVYVGRYHSWVARKDKMPQELIATAEDEDGNIMSVRHRTKPIFGVQYHPESFMCSHGQTIIDNWLATVNRQANHSSPI